MRLKTMLRTLYVTSAAYLKPGGRLYVVGYPHLFAPSGSWPLWIKLTGNVCSGVKAADADVLSELVDTLNDTIEDAAREANALVKASGRVVSFVRVDDLYANHELCGTDTAWINPFPSVDLEDRGDWLARLSPSFHPNAGGHGAVADRLASRVEPHLGAVT